MIYLDASAALAHLFGEDRRPPQAVWDGPLVSSRVLEYEVWNRVHAYDRAKSHGDAARALLGRVALLALDSTTLARALEPFPAPVRTLDALHLASLHALRARGIRAQLATYDRRMLAVARKLKLPIYALR
jgi:predicted nucleic acid-binding protein